MDGKVKFIIQRHGNIILWVVRLALSLQAMVYIIFLGGAVNFITQICGIYYLEGGQVNFIIQNHGTYYLVSDKTNFITQNFGKYYLVSDEAIVITQNVGKYI